MQTSSADMSNAEELLADSPMEQTLSSRQLPDSARICELESFLRERGLQRSQEFVELLTTCNLGTVGAVRLFPSVFELVAEMFDCSTKIGKLQAQGFHATLLVSHAQIDVYAMHAAFFT